MLLLHCKWYSPTLHALNEQLYDIMSCANTSEVTMTLRAPFLKN